MTDREAAEAAYRLFADPAAGPEEVIALLHDDVVFECPFYADFAPRVGKDVVAAMMRRMDGGGDDSYFREQRFPSHELLATADPGRFVIEAQGDHVIRATGKPYRNHYFHCLEIEDGRIVRWVEYSNPNEHARAAAAE